MDQNVDLGDAIKNDVSGADDNTPIEHSWSKFNSSCAVIGFFAALILAFLMFGNSCERYDDIAPTRDMAVGMESRGV